MKAVFNYGKTFMLLAGLTALMGAMGYVFGGISWAIIMLVIAGGMNFFAYWQSDTLVLKMHNAVLLPENRLPQVHAIVERLARKAGIPKPKLYIVPDPTPNAFATGRNPEHAAIAVNEGILELLSDSELEGVLAHETAHIVNRDILISTVTATIAGAISMLAHIGGYMFLFFGSSDDDGPNPLAALLLMILAPLVATIIQMAISRSREYEADKLGAYLAGNPSGLAKALAKLDSYSARYEPSEEKMAVSHMYISNPFNAEGLSSLFSTHPPIKERIKRLLNDY